MLGNGIPAAVRNGLLLCGLLASLVAPISAQQAREDSRVRDLVRAGKLRIGVFPSFQYSKDATTGEPRGLALGIANALAARLGVADVITVEFPTPPQVIGCVKTDDCDVGFMLIDPARANEVDFTPAFVRSDFTYLVPANSPLQNAADSDRPGVRIAVVRGHASTISLMRLIRHAEPVYAETFEAAIELVSSGKADAFASIREVLLQYSARLPNSRVLNDSYLVNSAGMAVPKGRREHLAYFSEFLDDVKRSGLMKRLVDEAGLRGVEVVGSP